MLGTKRVAIVSAVFIALLCGAAPAFADDIYGNVNCSQNPTPACDLDAGHGRQDGRGAGDPIGVGGDGEDSGNDGLECRYVPVDYQDPVNQPVGPGGWFMVLCSPDGKDPLSHGPVWIAGAAPALSAAQVADIARRRLRIPEPTLAANPSGDQLVNLPTWLWLSSGWRQTSASASVPGVSVTAVATPTSVTWSMGDGSTVRCTGAGTPYRAGMDPKAPSPDCGHVYRRSSASQAGQAFPVTATVRWTVTWSGAGQGGTFPDMTTTGNARFRVAESQALNSGG